MRKAILKIHLWLGLAGAVFLVILGVTGSIIAFEGDIDHWLHPGIWYITPGPRKLPEADLIRNVEQRYAPARVAAVEIFRQANLVRRMEMSDDAAVFVNPYDGSILGRVTGRSTADRMLGYIHQIHLRLVPDPRSAPALAKIGKMVVNYAGLILCLMVPSGVILWWRAKLTSINWRGSWFRISFDTHQVTGVFAALFLFIAAFTGVLIGFESAEKAIYALTQSSRPAQVGPVPSEAAAGATSIAIDQAMGIARGAIPDATIAGVFLPMDAKASYSLLMRVPEETSETVHSLVSVDQYSGKVLQVYDFKKGSMGYRVIRFNRSIHTGDVLGTSTHILMSLSSLVLVVMVITGCVIWWKKLAI